MIRPSTCVLCVGFPTTGHAPIQSRLAPLFDGPVEFLPSVTVAEALAMLQTRPVDLILLAPAAPNASTDDGVHTIRQAAPHCAVIVLLPRQDEAASLAAIRHGAHETLSLTDSTEQDSIRVLARAFARVGREASMLLRPVPSIPARPAPTKLLHDLNNLMTSVNGFADLLLTRLAADDPARPSAEQIRQAGKRAAALLKSQRLLADAPSTPAASTVGTRAA